MSIFNIFDKKITDINKPKINNLDGKTYEGLRNNYNKTGELILPDPRKINPIKTVIPNGWTKQQYEKAHEHYKKTDELILPQMKKPDRTIPTGWDSKLYDEKKREYKETGELVLPQLKKPKLNYAGRGSYGTYLQGQQEIPSMTIEVNGHLVDRLCQQDDKWANEKYGNSTYGKGGCGATSMSNALACQGVYISPFEMGELVSPSKSTDDNEVKYKDMPTDGTDSTLFPEMTSQLGIESRRTTNPLIAMHEMEHNGAVAVIKVPGHYITMTDWNKETGKAHVMDPDIQEILKNPDGVYDIEYITSRAWEYTLVYPKDADNIASQETFDERSSDGSVSCLVGDYDKIADNGWQ